jgi:predicted acyltransferase
VLAYGASFLLPVNKTVWTAPYALLTAGIAALALAACYLFVDVAGIRVFTRPFVWLGVNPLAVYFLSEVAGHVMSRPVRIAGESTTLQSWIFWNVFDPLLGERLSAPALSLLIGLLIVLVWTAVAGLLYRRGTRIVV